MRMIHPGSSYHYVLTQYYKKILKHSWYISEGQHCPFDVILVAFHLTLERAFLILFDASERKLDSARKRNERTVVERRAKLKKKAVRNSRNYISIYFVQYNIALT